MINIPNGSSQSSNKKNTLRTMQFTGMLLVSLGSSPQLHATTEVIVEEGKAAIQLGNSGIISQQSDISNYRLPESITKAEVAKYAVKINGITTGSCEGNIYVDVNHSIGDSCVDIESLGREGFLDASATFHPFRKITGNELRNMIIHKGDEKAYKECNFNYDMTGLMTRGSTYRIISCILQNR